MPKIHHRLKNQEEHRDYQVLLYEISQGSQQAHQLFGSLYKEQLLGIGLKKLYVPAGADALFQAVFEGTWIFRYRFKHIADNTFQFDRFIEETSAGLADEFYFERPPQYRNRFTEPPEYQVPEYLGDFKVVFPVPDNPKDKDSLFTEISLGNYEALGHLKKLFNDDLYGASFSLLKRSDLAMEVVDNTFRLIWKYRFRLNQYRRNEEIMWEFTLERCRVYLKNPPPYSPNDIYNRYRDS
ncbi:hypothetical protein [Mucilaginibacter paludis]|uniref:Uncharacterized protein n=1 Tax=Mucilaginibacter paludis DSM 18603 TaxID=714943 RepID=H1YBW0_9SPHI|nr:hypothetical protein [Mucilaginibacter paludis]EHQ27038.1 hypothetical protein Mucpa_2930 [Mucilaginibacter paludis DSM 18603]